MYFLGCVLTMASNAASQMGANCSIDKSKKVEADDGPQPYTFSWFFQGFNRLFLKAFIQGLAFGLGHHATKLVYEIMFRDYKPLILDSPSS